MVLNINELSKRTVIIYSQGQQVYISTEHSQTRAYWSVYTERERERESERGFSSWNILVICRGTVQRECKTRTRTNICSRERPP